MKVKEGQRIKAEGPHTERSETLLLIYAASTENEKRHQDWRNS